MFVYKYKLSNRKAIKRRYTCENTQTNTQVTINILLYLQENPLPRASELRYRITRGNYLHFNR